MTGCKNTFSENHFYSSDKKKIQISTHIGGESEMEEMQKNFMLKNKLKVIWWGCFAIK